MLIGRDREKKILADCIDSQRAEFIAVYGRRRVGKTYLVKQYFNNSFSFYVTGIYAAGKEDQLKNFYRRLNEKSRKNFVVKDNWFDAFEDLRMYLSSIKDKK